MSSPSYEAPATVLYVLIPPSPLFAAHWSIFLPDMLPYNAIARRHEESHVGRRIHVSGDRLNGFRLEFVREYDVKKDRGVGSRRFAVGTVPPQFLHAANNRHHAQRTAELSMRKDEDEGGGFVDDRPVDEFERLCVNVEAPGPSLNKVSLREQAKNVKSRPKEARDCQWWVRQVVQALTDRQMLLPLAKSTESKDVQRPTETVAQLPVH